MKDNSKPVPGLDIVTPIIELFHEFSLLIGKLLIVAFEKGFDSLSGTKSQLKLIEHKKLRSKKYTSKPDSLGVDTRTNRNVLLSEIDFRRHSFIVGGSGFGKTNLLTVLQEHTLATSRPIIFIDPKGDLETLNAFRDLCAKYQRTCYIFSEYHADSILMNPLKEGTVNQIVSRLMNCFEWTNEYYRSQCEQALFTVCKKITSSGERCSIGSILTNLKLIETEEISGIISNLVRIQESDFGRLLVAGSESLTLSSIRKEQACLYIGLSVQGYGETARTVGRMFLGELLYNSYMTMRSCPNGEGLKNPLSVHFDELGALLVPDFIELLNKCRSAGIELTMAVQSPADLAKYNETLPIQIIENSGNVFVLKQRVDDSAAFFSKAIGTTISTKSTHVTEDGETQSKGSVREVYELLAHPDIIKNLGIGQCVLLQQAPSRLRLINIRDRGRTALQKNVVVHEPDIF